jgi:hypothetical protein
VSGCAHADTTPADGDSYVICCRCLDVFVPKPTMGELVERLENLGKDDGPAPEPDVPWEEEE